mmetsp:Transcript_29255/g.41707  ORF Transcript_29255/g.41707 Transcript_29255/m.41707 type:complete len:244 (+) Transcript_29255:19-750(+)
MSEVDEEVVRKPSNDIDSRLFNLRMKINQGRKANTAEVQEEYKRFTDPKYEQKAMKKRYQEKLNAGNKPSDSLEETIQSSVANISASVQQSNSKDTQAELLSQTAEQAERAREKAQRKADNMSTFGWQAFTVEASYKAYDKSLKKLPTASSIAAPAPVLTEENALGYGTLNAKVSKHALDRLSQDIVSKQEARTKNSRRRMTVESADIDHINDRNAAFNKKIKRAFDKYTVEIRQNLERGTAV